MWWVSKENGRATSTKLVSLRLNSFPRPSARVLIRTLSRFLILEVPGGPTVMETFVSDVKLNFCEYNFLLAISLRNRTAMNEMNEKHKNLMNTSNNSISEAVGKIQQDITIIQKTNADEDCSSADILSKVIVLEKQARKTSNFVFRDAVSKNGQGLNMRLLNSLNQDVKHEDGKFKNKRQDRLRQSFAKISNFVFRGLLMQRRLEKFRDTHSYQ